MGLGEKERGKTGLVNGDKLTVRHDEQTLGFYSTGG